MHSMHRIFLTERTIYVVLVDASIGNQDERAQYWLSNIQSFAKDAPVVLVLNKLDDGLQADVNANYLHDKYKGLKRIVKLSAKQYPQKRFNSEFRDVLLEEINRNAKPVAKEYAEDTGCLEFIMDFDYQPPNNLLHRLMVERHTELDINNVWRTGARFQMKELGYSAVVVIDGNTLRFYIKHADPMHRPNTYLTMLKANTDRIIENMGLKAPACKLIYKLNGKRDEFDFENLKLWQKLGMPGVPSPAHGTIIPFQDILNQSAPDGLEDEQKLLDAIVRSYINIQGEQAYRSSSENLRNSRIRDDLKLQGYDVNDQTLRGTSESGKGSGELDLLLYDESRKPWTAIEALRINSGSKGDWHSHLDKLVGNYNFFGARFLYLLTYVDTDDAFQRIWQGYEIHLQEYHPEGFAYVNNSFCALTDSERQYIKTAKCQYANGDSCLTVYHIFARTPPKK